MSLVWKDFWLNDWGSSSPGAPPAVVAQTTFINSSSTTTTSGAVTATAGNSLILLFGSSGGATGSLATVTDTGGNTWTLPDPPKGGLSSVTNTFIAAAYVHNCVSPGTLTVTHNSVRVQAIVLEVSGLRHAAPDVALEDLTNVTATTTIASPAGTPAESGEFLVALAVFPGSQEVTSVSPGTWTLAGQPAASTLHLNAAYKVGGAPASEQVTFVGLTTAQRYSSGLMAFAPANVVTGAAAQLVMIV